MKKSMVSQSLVCASLNPVSSVSALCARTAC